jgi:MFS family permease
LSDSPAWPSAYRSWLVPSERWFGLLIRLSVRTSTACLELVGSNPSLADGRQSIYLWGMPFLCVGSCGVALSTSLQSLLFWRFVQTFGCAGALPLGTGVIGDIYKLEERGTVIGVFFGVRDCMIEWFFGIVLTQLSQVILLGHVVAPFLGGKYIM